MLVSSLRALLPCLLTFEPKSTAVPPCADIASRCFLLMAGAGCADTCVATTGTRRERSASWVESSMPLACSRLHCHQQHGSTHACCCRCAQVSHKVLQSCLRSNRDLQAASISLACTMLACLDPHRATWIWVLFPFAKEPPSKLPKNVVHCCHQHLCMAETFCVLPAHHTQCPPGSVQFTKRL